MFAGATSASLNEKAVEIFPGINVDVALVWGWLGIGSETEPGLKEATPVHSHWGPANRGKEV